MNCKVVKRASELNTQQQRNVERWQKRQQLRKKRKDSGRKDLGHNAFAKALGK